MKKIRDGLHKKRERSKLKSTEIEARSLGERSGPHEFSDASDTDPSEMSRPEDAERPLTSDKSQRLDFATLGDRPEVDESENERNLSGSHVAESSPDGPLPNARPERVHQQLPNATP